MNHYSISMIHIQLMNNFKVKYESFSIIYYINDELLSGGKVYDSLSFNTIYYKSHACGSVFI